MNYLVQVSEKAQHTKNKLITGMELQKGIITKNDFFGSQSDYLAEY
ncbi:MAG: hypothetical protein WC755_07710 [Candidatus Woesearchaeota archaeon]|jgi:hypothetical protein